MKKLLSIAIIGILLSLFFFNKERGTQTNVYKKLPLQQRIGERFKQEAQFTRDPKTGKVPTERLIKAKAYTQKKLKEKGAVSGINWTERGPNDISGRTRSILIDAGDPTGKTLFSGGVAGGLWKSTDDGITWNPINEFFNNMAVTTIAQDPQNSNIIYFGTGEGWGNFDAGRGMGIWKSTDGGLTFSNISSTANNRDFDYVNKLIVQNYQGTSTLYAATSSSFANRGGLFISSNGGNSWTFFKGNGTGSNDFATDVEITGGRILAGFGGGNITVGSNDADGVYFSDNGGVSWAIAKPSFQGEGRIEIATSPSDLNKYYILVETLGNGTPPNIYTTILNQSNNTLNWISIIPPQWQNINCQQASNDFTSDQDWYDLAIAVYPQDPNSVLIGGVDLFLYQRVGTTDNWYQLSNWAGLCGFQKVHADQHAISFKNANEVYVANDGGIWKSSNASNGLNFSFLGTGFNITQFYSADIDPRSGVNYYIAGAQDNGALQLDEPNLSMNTTEITGGDGAFVHIDQLDHSIQISSYVNQTYYVSFDNWQTLTGINGSDGHFINPTDYDDVNKKLYASQGSNPGAYFRWDDLASGGTTASTVAVSSFPNNAIWSVRVSPNISGRTYFGFSNGQVIRVDNTHTGISKTGTSIMNLGLGNGHIVSCIEIEDGNENHILVTLSNYGITSVYESTNATSANPTWTAVEGNLPDMPVRWAMFNPTNSDQAFLATELGVWSTDNLNGASTNWGPTNAGLANTRIDMIKYRKSDLQMVVATHGRGLYTSDDLGAACGGTLTLNNQVISGTHLSSNSISITNSSVATSATLSSPNTSFASFTVNDQAQLTVNNDGCQ